MTKRDILEKKECEKKLYREAIEDVKLSEMLNMKNSGFIETEDGEKTYEIAQKEIKKNISQKVKKMCFNLDLEGPVFLKYTTNGRHLAIRNGTGSLSSLDTHTMSCHFELDLKEKLYDMSYLHNEDYIAVAQENCLFVYNKHGVELHAVRDNRNARLLEFLPYHFLLVSACTDGKLKYLDTTNGEIVSKVYIRDKEVSALKQNKRSAIIYTGHKNGIVNLWSPNSNSYLAKVLVHKNMVTGLEIDRTGTYLYTTGIDTQVNLWDIRNTYRAVNTVKTHNPVSCTSLSQNGLFAIGTKGSVKVFKDLEKKNIDDYLYLQHNEQGVKISSVCFRDYEDILTIGHSKGLNNIVVPGAGDSTYDTYEDSPFDSKEQKREKEVKRLLDKIPFELITYEQKIVAEDDTITESTDTKKIKVEQRIHKSALDRFRDP